MGNEVSVTLRRAWNKLWPDPELVDNDDILPAIDEILKTLAPNKEFGDEIKTSRDRPKSAPHPRLKNSKRTSNCQFTVLFKVTEKVLKKSDYNSRVSLHEAPIKK